MRNKFIHPGCIELCSRSTVIEGVFNIVLVFEVIIKQELAKMFAKVAESYHPDCSTFAASLCDVLSGAVIKNNSPLWAFLLDFVMHFVGLLTIFLCLNGFAQSQKTVGFDRGSNTEQYIIGLR